MFKSFLHYLKDENGQTSTEYILLVAVVALIVFKFKEKAVTELDELTTKIFGTAGDKIVNELNEFN
jgi:pilus assembly protein Flp/PilA